MAVGHGVGEAVGAHKVGGGRVGVAAVGVQREAAMGRIGGLGEGERQAHRARRIACQRSRDGVVGGGRGGIARCGGRHIGDGEADGGGGAAAMAVGHGVGEAVGAHKVGGGRVGVAAVGVQRDAAMGRIGGLGEGERQAHRARRIACQRSRDGVVGGGRGGIARCGRGHIGDGEADGGGGAAAMAVGHGVGEAVGAHKVGGGGVGVAAVGVQREAAMGRIGGLGEGERQAHRACRVACKRSRDGVVGGGRGGIARCGRGHVGDGEGDGGGGGAAMAVGDGVGEAVGAHKVGGGRVGVAAVGVHVTLPWAGSEALAKVSGRPTELAASLASVPETAWLAGVVAVSPDAVGATSATVRMTVAVAVPPWPSETV